MPTTATHQRIVDVATSSFVDHGVAATSLDGLARQLGVTKQTILYHFKSKDGLLLHVCQRSAEELLVRLEAAVRQTEPGWQQVETAVRAVFSLAVERPALLGLLREVSRLGPPASTEVLLVLQPLIDRSVASLEAGMASGAFRRRDPRLVLVAAYAVTTGVVTDAELLRAVGLDLDLRVAVGLRRTVLDFLEGMLVG